ncbi:RHS repeat-associated core domain-containing protein [Burkholderia aenigmatica]|uniref:Type IV secretion protein Rhs n=1 Tax=Burkholderia aenigmatica TaxID=2015348 RepID=A0A228I820_9BURK|nr:RHS repeat-associated core domain-containing protein [Burkholderia aenigmatica]OXI38581.1 type IV secretion protein Rhs [Burkholderia aenigmatica]
MALPAVKHLDPVVGVDVHSVLVTPGTPPVFLPHPHVGFMLDKREYLQAAKAVVGCIAKMIAQEKVAEYIEHHPEDVKKLEHLADEANQQANELMGGGKLPDFKDDPTIAEGMRLAKDANQIKNRISDDLGSNVGSGGSSGRPIFVNGMMRATAGTHAYHVPGLHFPLGESFAPPPEEVEPSNDGESFMGSKTVLANNDPMSYMALEALSCWSIGMEPPSHNSAHTDRTYPSMPSSVMLPIPAGRPVLVGGPPIMNMAAAAKGLFKAFRGSKWAKALADKLHLKSGFLRCNVLKAEPVDATTGEVVVQQRDFTVSGRLPLVWERHYSSHNQYRGAIGAGWQTPADIRLELMPHNGEIGAVACFPDHSTAFDALPADEGWPAHVYDWQYGYGLYRQDNRLILRTREGIEYGFVLPPQGARGIGDNAQRVLLTERMADLNGNAWVFERDEHGCVIRISEWTRDGPTARVVGCDTGAYTAAWLTGLTLIDGEGNAHPLVTYEQDDAGNLRAAIDAMAQPHRFDYTDGHRMVGHTSARGVSFYYSHLADDDDVWRVERAWGDNGLFDYRFSYDTARKETKITDSLGFTTTIQLNERRMPVVEIDPLGGVTTYQYDTQGRTSAETGPSGRVVRWGYNRCGDLVTQTLPDDSEIRTDYDANHRPVCVNSGDSRRWRYEWDMHGNLLTRVTPSGAVTRYSYNKYGQLIEELGPRGAVTRIDYDWKGSPASLTNALGHLTRFLHDAHGNLVETIDALGRQSRYTYDRNGNLIRAIEPGGREINCSYDANGNLIRYRDPTGHVTQIEYSALGQVSKRHAPDGTTVEYRYDTEGQLIGLVNEHSEFYALERDALGRIIVETDFWGQERRYRYGAAGELLYSTDSLGQTIEYRYDRLVRIVEKHAPDPERGGLVRVDNFEYDRNGNLTVAQNPSCRVEFRYDTEGRVIEEQQGDDFTIISRFDAAGNRTERRTRLVISKDIVEHVVRYSYDLLDAVSSIQIDDTTPLSLERDALGQVLVEQLGENLRRELSYEAGGQLASQRTLLTNTGVLFASEYAYDANGDLVEKRDSHSGIDRLQYDLVGRVTAHIDPTGRIQRFLYDSTGNLLKTRIRQRRTADAIGTRRDDTWLREGEYNDCHFEYDSVGNLIRKWGATQDLNLHWDAAGQLVKTASTRTFDPASQDQPTQIRAIYEYDALRRRMRKVVNEFRKDAPEQAARSSDSRFFWDGDILAAEHITSNRTGKYPKSLINSIEPNTPRAVEATQSQDLRIENSRTEHTYEWIHYPNTFQLAAAVHCTHIEPRTSTHLIEKAEGFYKELYFYQRDPNGAPVRMHDVNGNVVWEATYNPTGKTGDLNSRVTQLSRLQGQYLDEETGLHYNRYRYYDPQTGSYTSQDPIGLDGGLNLYQFAPNVFGWIDPLGLARYGNTGGGGTTGQNSSELSRNLSLEGRAVGLGEAAGHVVASGGSQRQWASSVESRSILATYGVHINDAANGIPIGHPRPHNSMHNRNFHEGLRDRLKSIVKDMRDAGYGRNAIRGALRRELRRTGDCTLNP